MRNLEQTATISEICREHGITPDGEHAYRVQSSSGNGEYVVHFVGRGDCGEILWECNCLAGQHGRECKHVRAAIAANNEINNTLGWE